MKCSFFATMKIALLTVLFLFICDLQIVFKAQAEPVKVGELSVDVSDSVTKIIIPVSGVKDDNLIVNSYQEENYLILDLEEAVFPAVKYVINVDNPKSAVGRVVIAQNRIDPTKRVRAVITMREWVPYEIKEEKDAVIILCELPSSLATKETGIAESKSTAAAVSESSESKIEEKDITEEIDKPEKATSETEAVPFSASAPKEGLDTLVTLDFRDVEIGNVIRILAEKSGLNIVAGPEIVGKVTIHLKDVSVKNALDTILPMHNYTYEKVAENIYRIVKVTPTPPPPPPLEVKTFTLKYKSVDDVKNVISGLFPEAQIKLVPFKDTEPKIAKGTGILIVAAPKERMDAISELIAQLDKPEKQVMIEARLVSVEVNKLSDLGAELDIFYKSSKGEWAYNLTGHSPGVGRLTNVVQGPGNFVFQILGEGTRWDIEGALQAAVEKRFAEILANPKILALNNTEAVIDITKTHPYVEWTYDAQTRTYVGTPKFDQKSGITLKVTPQITDELILMKVAPSEKVFRESLSYPSAGGAPDTVVPVIDERKAEVTLLVKDGQTIVIGGLRKKEERISEKKVPGLGDIPLFGNLFKTKTKDQVETELLLFITPHIVKEGAQLTAEEQIKYNEIDFYEFK